MAWSRMSQMARIREDRRRMPRDEVDLVTMATRTGKIRISVRLVDISPLGFHCRSAETFERGEKIRILLPLVGDIEAEIAWALKGCFGGWFNENISSATYPRLLATIKTGRNDWRES